MASKKATQPSPLWLRFQQLSSRLIGNDDLLLRTMWTFTKDVGLRTVPPLFEIFMLGTKTLFLTMEPLGIRELVKLVCGRQDGNAEEFFKFDDCHLMLIVTDALQKAVDRRLQDLRSSPEWAWDPVASIESILSESNPAPSSDLLVWCAFAKVAFHLVRLYESNSTHDWSTMYTSLTHILYFFAMAADARQPLDASGQTWQVPEVKSAGMAILAYQRCWEELESDDDKQVIRELFHLKFWSDFSELGERCLEHLDRALAIRSDFLGECLANVPLRCTYLARGGKSSQLNLADHNRCFWIESLLKEPQKKDVTKAGSLNAALNTFVTTPCKFQPPQATRSDLKQMCTHLNRFRAKPTALILIRTRRFLEALPLNMREDRVRIDGSNIKQEVQKSLLHVMLTSNRAKDFHTFAMTIAPISIMHIERSLVPDQIQEIGLLGWLKDALNSDCDIGVCQACALLSVFCTQSRLKIRVAELGFLEHLTAKLKKCGNRPVLLAHLAMSLQPMADPSAGVMTQGKALKHIPQYVTVLRDVLENKYDFSVYRQHIRSHEVIVHGIVVLSAAPAKVYDSSSIESRKHDNVREWTLVGLLSLLQGAFNTVEVIEKFSDLGGVPLLHRSICDSNKQVQYMALKTMVTFMRLTTDRLQKVTLQIKTFLADVSRVWTKLKSSTAEETALSLLMLLTYPWPDKQLTDDWFKLKNTREKVIPKLLNKIHAPFKSIDNTTNAMAILSIVGKNGPDDLKQKLMDGNIWSSIVTIVHKTPEQFGLRSAGEACNYAMLLAVSLTAVNQADAIKNGLIEAALRFAARPLPGLTVNQRHMLLNHSMNVLEHLCGTVGNSPGCEHIMKAGTLDRINTLLILCNLNLGAKAAHDIDPSLQLSDIDPCNQYRWHEALLSASVVKRLAMGDGKLFSEELVRRPDLINSILHLLLMARDDTKDTQRLVELCNCVLLMISATFTAHFTPTVIIKKPKPEPPPKTALEVLLSFKQTFYKGKYNNALMLDTLIELTVESMDYKVAQAAGRAVDSLDTLLKEDPVLVYLVVDSPAYNKYKDNEKLTYHLSQEVVKKAQVSNKKREEKASKMANEMSEQLRRDYGDDYCEASAVLRLNGLTPEQMDKVTHEIMTALPRIAAKFGTEMSMTARPRDSDDEDDNTKKKKAIGASGLKPSELDKEGKPKVDVAGTSVTCMPLQDGDSVLVIGSDNATATSSPPTIMDVLQGKEGVTAHVVSDMKPKGKDSSSSDSKKSGSEDSDDDSTTARRQTDSDEKASNTAKQKIPRMCHACSKVIKKWKLCSRCRQIGYCGRDCQRDDWPNHRLVCQPKVEEQEATTQEE